MSPVSFPFPIFTATPIIQILPEERLDRVEGNCVHIVIEIDIPKSLGPE